MKALGKGSLAAFVETGLGIARVVLWAVLGVWAAAFLAYVVFVSLVGVGVLDPSLGDLGSNGNLRIRVLGVDSEAIDAVRWTDWHLIVPSLLVAGVGIGGSLIIITQLRLMFDSFRSGEPFRRENANHLRIIWMTMVAIEISRYALMGLMTALLYQVRDPAVRAISLSLDSERLSTWGSILILIVLAEVFREGARLKEEQELTI